MPDISTPISGKDSERGTGLSKREFRIAKREVSLNDAKSATGTKFKLRLEIDTLVLKGRPSDNLCIARKVNGKFNVVLLGASINPTGLQTQLQVYNDFTWENTFQAFCAKEFKLQVPVSKACKGVEVKFGQQATYDSKGLHMTDAIPAHVDMFSGGEEGEHSAQDSFIIARVPSGLQGACECRVRDNNDQENWYPMYVDPGRHPTTADIQITPSNEYVIFWDPYLTPNATFPYFPRTEKQEFSFKDEETEISIRFGWITSNKPTPNEAARFYVF
ncbi:hypothetical protein KAF25_002003 [Fusarium avenaceum]|uniref:Uncharacterized protein n=1 Tax=Fusarium avenaceum TaxID=40199 RepID=A0A9P7GTV1_9HYPO|nr:hypothetical protein KAF25_002003 [Fusarium avenaceum]